MVVGHAYGNSVARMVAADHPRLVKGVVLLAAGGLIPRSKDTEEKFVKVFDPAVSKEERTAAIGATFFASGHATKEWAEGWYFDVAKDQMAARGRTPTKEWWGGGSAPILVLQGAKDLIAVPENSERLAKEFPDRVRVIELPGIGHAMLPENPEMIASVLLNNIR